MDESIVMYDITIYIRYEWNELLVMLSRFDDENVLMLYFCI